jgi:hypothetical protein
VSLPTRAFSDLRASLRRRTVLLILVASLAAALLSDVLVEVMTMTILDLEGTHVLHVLVTIPAAIWVARKVGTAPVLYGVIVGLFSGIVNQVYNHALEGTLTLYEVSVIVPLSVAAGGLGGIIARSTLVLRSSKTINKGTPPMPTGLLRTTPNPWFRPEVELFRGDPRSQPDLLRLGEALSGH